MGKQGKKKGKKDGEKEQSSQSTEMEQQPSTSTVPEEEEDIGLTGGSRKKKEKKEKKEKALQALQALQAGRKATTSISEPTEPSSTAIPEPIQPPPPEVPPVKPSDDLKEETEEFEGLGLQGNKKRRPKKKKQESAPATVTSATVPVLPSPGAASVQLPATAPPPGLPASASAPVLVQMPEPVKSAPSGPWRNVQSAGRGRGWGPPSAQPVAVPGPTRSIVVPTPTPQPTSYDYSQPQQPTQYTHIGSKQPQSSRPGPRSLEPVACKYKIPMKIPQKSVRAAEVIVTVNYLEMQFKALRIARYDISFSPDRPKKMMPVIFKQVKMKYFPNELVAFDQMKNCYTLNPLKIVVPNERFHTTVELQDMNGKNMSFDVSIKFTGFVDLGNIKRYMANRGSSLCHPTEEVQCIDVILRQGALESYVKAGRQFFKRPSRPIDLGYGFEMWTGLFQSAIFTNKAFINIDVAHKGFPKNQPMIDAVRNDFSLDPSSRLDRQRGIDYFTSFVKGLKVVVLLVGNTPSAGQRREYICNGMVGPPHELVFTINETDGRSRKLTVAEYFMKDKNYRLKFPNLNCLWVGHRDRSIYFPIELCEIAYGQPLTRQLNDVQVSKMVREAATPPDDRLFKIKEVISNMQYSKNKDLKAFGLDISEKFYQVKAKILDPPTLDIGSGQRAIPRKGQWQANRLLKPEPLQHWGLVAVDTDPRNDYENLIALIKSAGTQMGMSVSPPKIINVHARMTNLHAIFMNAMKDVRLLFIIVSTRGRDDYHKVKQMAEREVGILTQCIKEATARRMNAMTAKNILLKVNSKLMGINQAIDVSNLPRCLKGGGVMIVGADVTHPSPDQSNIPSIAAVTASMDSKCYMYNIELSVQTPKKEVIVEFEDMMFDHLKVYKERNDNQLPRKIFVFRDGVSEGQFAQVMNHELNAVHIAYERMAGHNKRPEVLFLLVQKRHHTRLFSEGGNSCYNVQPGTVVDTEIVHASELDFYLVSHQAIKGTARPTRYHAICNDGKIPDDEVEQLTYYLCHLYSRCMRSVSYPTPTYYAHLACLRARSLTHGERFDNRELERKPKRLHVLERMLQYSRMFFV